MPRYIVAELRNDAAKVPIVVQWKENGVDKSAEVDVGNDSCSRTCVCRPIVVQFAKGKTNETLKKDLLQFVGQTEEVSRL